MKSKTTLSALLTLTLALAAVPAAALMDDDAPNAYAREQIPRLSQYYDFANYGVNVYVSDEWILFDGEKLPRSEFRLCRDGYYRIKDNIVIFDEKHNLVAWRNETLRFEPLAEDGAECYGLKTKCYPSSFLTETIGGKKIAYDAKGLNDIFKKPRRRDWMSGDWENYRLWNAGHKPWVAGGGGYGVGESITLEFAEPICRIALLNGYVAPAHSDYYKKNSRVKKIKVQDEDGREYTFDLADEVRVQSFSLGSLTNSAKITILDVYKGEKYKDTCLSLAAGTNEDDYHIYRALEDAKENVEDEGWNYSWLLKKYPDKVPHGQRLTKRDWSLYSFYIKDKISREFGGKYPEHDIEIYSSPELKVHLSTEYYKIYLAFYSKEKISRVSYSFDVVYAEDNECWEWLSVKDKKAERRSEKNGFNYFDIRFGNVLGDYLALPLSAEITVEYNGGKKQRAVLSKSDLEKVRRFG